MTIGSLASGTPGHLVVRNRPTRERPLVRVRYWAGTVCSPSSLIAAVGQLRRSPEKLLSGSTANSQLRPEVDVRERQLAHHSVRLRWRRTKYDAAVVTPAHARNMMASRTPMAVTWPSKNFHVRY
jgi:hypothetical protein